MNKKIEWILIGIAMYSIIAYVGYNSKKSFDEGYARAKCEQDSAHIEYMNTIDSILDADALGKHADGKILILTK